MQELDAGSRLLGGGNASSGLISTCDYSIFYFNLFCDFYDKFPNIFDNFYQHVVNKKSLLIMPKTCKALAYYQLLTHGAVIMSDCFNEISVKYFIDLAPIILQKHEEEWQEHLMKFCFQYPHLFSVLHEYLIGENVNFSDKNIQILYHYRLIKSFDSSCGVFYFSRRGTCFLKKYYTSIIQERNSYYFLSTNR